MAVSDCLQVDDTLESVNVGGIFAAGDICHIVKHPRPKAGVFAVRAGPPLARNLRSKALGQQLETWEPQTSFLGIIGTGEVTECVASKAGMAVQGAWLWELKDYIDRNWMAGYSNLPAMEADEESLSALVLAGGNQDVIDALRHKNMRCLGCAAKVPADILSRVMRRLNTSVSAQGNKPADRTDILVGLEHGDDAAVVAVDPRSWASVHTIDFLRSMVDDPYLLGMIAANHALSDCYAMGAEPRTALAVAVVPFGLSDKVEDTLLQMMSGSVKVLHESNCVLIGGHTTEGPDLSLGFAITGAVAYPEGAMRKGSLGDGQVLVLTKALGTGVVLAAHMRSKARGRWVSACIESMCVSNFAAAKILVKHSAAGCTDVTGFGLLGHLGEMLRESNVVVHLDLSSLPSLPGAVESFAQSVTSSLHAANSRHSLLLSNVMDPVVKVKTAACHSACVCEHRECLPANMGIKPACNHPRKYVCAQSFLHQPIGGQDPR
jgi:selenide,water dikinase